MPRRSASASSLLPVAALGALVTAALLAGCGSGGSGTSTTIATATTAGASSLRCAGGSTRVTADPRDDVLVQSATGPERSARSPSADLVAVTVRRGAGPVVCVTFRTAGPVRTGSTFSFTVRRGGAGGRPPEEQRYEIQLAPGRPAQVSRPQGEPRYPVRAVVTRRGSVLAAALQTAPAPGASWYAWQAELVYLPRFPLGDRFTDTVPGGGEWAPAPGTGP